jgi:energy-converting hydrogenase A subunit D
MMYPILDLINLTTVSAAVALIGAAGLIMLPKPIDKVIMLAVLEGGFIGMVVAAKYLDVAMVAAIFDPISTVILLMAIIKINDIRRKKSQEEGVVA